MAMQSNCVNLDPAYVAAHTSNVKVKSAGSKKKEQEELAKLASIVQLLEQELAGCKGGKNTTSQSGMLGSTRSAVGDKEEENLSSSETLAIAANGTTNSSQESESIAQMTLALEMLQVFIAKYQHDQAKNTVKISEGELKAAQAQLVKINNEIAAIHREEEKRKHESFWEKAASIFITAVVDVVAIVTAQPEIAIMATAMCAMTVTGGFNKITEGVAKLLVDMKVPAKDAQVAAAVFVAVVVAALSYAAAPECANSDALLGMKACMAIQNGVQVSMSNGALVDVYNAIIADIPMSSAKRKKAKKIGDILVQVIQMLMMVLSGLGEARAMKDSASSAGKYGNSLIGRNLNKLIEMVNTRAILNVGLVTESAATLIEQALSIYGATITIKNGQLKSDMANTNAIMSLINTAMNMNNNVSQSNQKQAEQMINNVKTDHRTLANLAAGDAAIARALCSNNV